MNDKILEKTSSSNFYFLDNKLQENKKYEDVYEKYIILQNDRLHLKVKKLEDENNEKNTELEELNETTDKYDERIRNIKNTLKNIIFLKNEYQTLFQDAKNKIKENYKNSLFLNKIYKMSDPLIYSILSLTSYYFFKYSFSYILTSLFVKFTFKYFIKNFYNINNKIKDISENYNSFLKFVNSKEKIINDVKKNIDYVDDYIDNL